MLRPIDDPLNRLVPLGDTTPPTVGDINFMRGEDDSNDPHDLDNSSGMLSSGGGYRLNQNERSRIRTHRYFMAPDWSSQYTPQAKIVGSLATTTNANGQVREGDSNIEIIANATDVIKGGLTVGVRSMEFSATGKLVGKTIPSVRPINFSGQFVFDPEQPAGTQTYQAFTLSDLVRVTYENDYVSPSNPSSESGTTTFFHILSNSDGANSTVESNDRFRYWRSKVIQGSAQGGRILKA